MEKHFKLQINSKYSLSFAKSELKKNGITPYYEERDGRLYFLGIASFLSKEELKAKLTSIASVEEIPHVVDWKAQWELHAHGFDGEYATVDLKEFGFLKGEIKLKYGPGFGNLSHPTTRLCLEMLSGMVENKRVLDIGCGSGVLSIAAAAGGATTVLGIDICPDSITHSKENVKKNSYDGIITIADQIPFRWIETPPDVVVMNMVPGEQEHVWNTYKNYLEYLESIFILSGVPTELESSYLENLPIHSSHILKKSLNNWSCFTINQTKFLNLHY